MIHRSNHWQVPNTVVYLYTCILEVMKNKLSITPQRVVSLVDRVFEALEDAVVTGQLTPGQVVTDRTLSTQLGVSRTPVREALQRLAASGLVRPRDHGPGWQIADFDEQDLRELFELRRALEPIGLRRLLEDVNSDLIRLRHRLGRFFDDFESPIEKEDYPRYFQRDNEFHNEIVGASNNSRVVNFYGIIERQIDRGRQFLSTGYHGRVEENLAEHRAITRAIADGQVDAAIDALQYHLRRGEELMVEHIRAERAAGRL